MKKLIATYLMGVSLSALATVPAGYYDSLDGKAGDALLEGLRLLSAEHVKISYGDDTWAAFEKTDMRMVNGRKAWWDMYSNNLVYLPDHGALNIEHSVAKSWWNSEKNYAYSDLFHLNPSDQNANNKKGNYPPGEVADARLLDNGITRIGTPAAGLGGGAASVFEPADEYKGDFARAYFYIFTAYPDINWQDSYQYVYSNGGTLRPWAVEMLLKWHRQDPVDSKEKARNEEIYALQGNRNPFIDYPALAEIAFGSASSAFSLSDAKESESLDRPATPEFAGGRVVGVNTYARRWWDAYMQRIDAPEGTLMLSVDGGEWFPFSGNSLEVDGALNHTESHIYRAYAVKDVDGQQLRSPIAELRLAALDPDAIDYSQARWHKVTNVSEVNVGDKYILLSSNTLHSMSITGGTSSTQFMESAGFVEFDEANEVVELPTDAAILEFAEGGEAGKYRIMIEDVNGNFKGNWNATAKNKMRLDATQYKPGSWDVSDTGAFKFTFTEFGTLQFNKTQPRFLQYESSQTPVYLYRYVDMSGGTSGISEAQEERWSVGVDGCNIYAPVGSRIFDLNGRPVSGSSLSPGIYIVAGKGRCTKVLIR